jgi:histidinol-phosphate aminotransferase
VSPDQLVVGSGIDDLLGLIVRTFVAPGTPVVASRGSYPTFAYHVAGYGGVMHDVAYRHDHNDLDGLADATRRTRARLVYLANPDNPSGTVYSAPDIAAFRSGLPDDALLVLDEAYVDFAPAGTPYGCDADDPRIIRLLTFSKAHGLAGLRIGYAVASRRTIRAFDKVRLHFGVNGPAQAAAVASLEDRGFLNRVIEQVDHGRHDYYRLAARLGLTSVRSATNFVAIDLGSRAAADMVRHALDERSVFVRSPRAAPLDSLIRVTVGLPHERDDFAETLGQVVPLVAASSPQALDGGVASSVHRGCAHARQRRRLSICRRSPIAPSRIPR